MRNRHLAALLLRTDDAGNMSLSAASAAYILQESTGHHRGFAHRHDIMAVKNSVAFKKQQS